MKRLLSFLLFITTSPLLKAQSATEATLPRIHLTDSIACTPIKDQAGSPTCWVFGTNSLFESDLIKKNGKSINLSEMFIARYAYIDKARQFLATKGKTYFEGGGQFHDVIRVANEYGMVPEEVYDGLLARIFHNHAGLDTAMKTFTYGLLESGKIALDSTNLRQMNDTLDKYLGIVPANFIYDQKLYTPKTFAEEVVMLGNDYVEIVSFADQPLYKQFILADKYNWANDTFYNISLDDMLTVVDTALHKGWSVGWEGDVTEDGFHYYSGYASFADSVHRFDEERLVNYKTEVTERDHMLHITGIGKDDNNKKWYYLKNSWGIWLSRYKGFIFMEENYFRLKTVILFVNKQALPAALKEKLNIN
jgi:bleomycin hydrolase